MATLKDGTVQLFGQTTSTTGPTRGGGGTGGLLGSGSKGRANNPKFADGRPDAAQVSPKTGLNIGGKMDRVVQKNQASQGSMLSDQLFKDRSIGLTVPGMNSGGTVNTKGYTRTKGTGKISKQGSG